MTDRVLVTGAGGFTGRYVVDALLARGCEVWGLEARPGGAGRARVYQVDLLGPTEPLIAVLREFQPSHVIHLAAQSHVTGSSADSHYTVNTIGTERLLRAVAEHARDVKRILLASTANVYGNVASESIPESTSPAPVNHYGFSKLVMEQIAQGWFAGLPITITRPFNYTGVGQSSAFLVPKVVHHFAAGLPVIRLGNIDVHRDISDVRFVTEAYCRLLYATVPGGIVNVCSGKAISVRGIVAGLERISGRTIRVEIDPALVRANEITVLAGSNRLLKAAIGSIEMPDFNETLGWMYQCEVSGR